MYFYIIGFFLFLSLLWKSLNDSDHNFDIARKITSILILVFADVIFTAFYTFGVKLQLAALWNKLWMISSLRSDSHFIQWYRTTFLAINWFILLSVINFTKKICNLVLFSVDLFIENGLTLIFYSLSMWCVCKSTRISAGSELQKFSEYSSYMFEA